MTVKSRELIVVVPESSDENRDAEGCLTREAMRVYGVAAIQAGQPDVDPLAESVALEDVQVGAIDAIANVLHFLDRAGLDPEAVLTSARMHYEAELRERAEP